MWSCDQLQWRALFIKNDIPLFPDPGSQSPLQDRPIIHSILLHLLSLDHGIRCCPGREYSTRKSGIETTCFPGWLPQDRRREANDSANKGNRKCISYYHSNNGQNEEGNWAHIACCLLFDRKRMASRTGWGWRMKMETQSFMQTGH